jgi:hypothetical protein
MGVGGRIQALGAVGMTKQPQTPLAPAMERLIDALADQFVKDYLTAEAAARRDHERQRSERVPLLATDKAA